MLSKQYYILIANSIVTGIDNYKNSNTSNPDTILIASIVTSIADALASDNSSFSKHQFFNYILDKIRSS